MVMPSRQETFGITALEAMASSKPVVFFDIAHLNEVVLAGWGEVVPYASVTSFAASVARLWQDVDRCEALGIAGFNAAQAFRWDELAVRQGEIYKEVAGGR